MKYVIAIAGLIAATGAVLEMFGMPGSAIDGLVAAVVVVVGTTLLDRFLDAIEHGRPLAALAAGAGTVSMLVAPILMLNAIP